MVALSDRQLTEQQLRKPRRSKQTELSYGEMVEITKEQILSDRTLTEGQRNQALRFLSYAPGRGRGGRAGDPINRSNGVQIAINYLRIIKEYRENLDNLSEHSFRSNRQIGGKNGVIRFRKKGSGKGRVGKKPQYTNLDYQPHPNTVISNEGIVHVVECVNKVTLRSQVLELLLHEMEERDNHAGLPLKRLVELFPDRTQNAVKSCLNKAVNQGHLKYSLRTGLYHL